MPSRKSKRLEEQEKRNEEEDTSEPGVQHKDSNMKRGTGNAKGTPKNPKDSKAKNRCRKKQSPEVITINDSDSNAGSVWFSDDDGLRIKSARRVSNSQFGNTGYNIVTHLVSQSWKSETTTAKLRPDALEKVCIVIAEIFFCANMTLEMLY